MGWGRVVESEALTCIFAQSAMEEVTRRNLMGLFMPIDPVSAMLVIMVTRVNIVKDTLRTLEKCKPQDFKKPLKVGLLLCICK